VDITGAVTAGAAGLAAVLAGVNLYVSGRRELGKWKREALVETLALFLDASFTHGSMCHTILAEPLPEPEVYRLREAAIAAHDNEAATLTRLRLLASAEVVDRARALIDAEWHLANACFCDPPRTADKEKASEYIREARGNFLESARDELDLDETIGTGRFDRAHNWRDFRIKMNQYKNNSDNELAR
jgi:hypothetical protein